MKPDLDGRTVLGLQPRHKAPSETYREKSSDLAILELDPASGGGEPPKGFSHSVHRLVMGHGRSEFTEWYCSPMSGKQISARLGLGRLLGGYMY